ncbi:MAG TPA: hypothetical protein VNY05_24390 [Candidatus Acidoferrales bacterium]|nr:hypothetical protein [Candidatus Acidoferrales bacterium]
MLVFRPLSILALTVVLCVLSVVPCPGATFGTLVTHSSPLGDLVVDEARKRLYVVDTNANAVEVYVTNVSPPRLAPGTSTIKVEKTPLAAALSRSGKFLYVVCYDASALDIIDLTTANFSTRSVTLAAKPEGVAVGVDSAGLEHVLITTIGTGTGQAVLITFDPNAGASAALSTVIFAPPAPTIPQLPPPNNLMYLAGKSRLQASLDGRTIIGVNIPATPANSRTVFVYDVASAIVLSSRNVAGASPILAVAPDGQSFVSGSMLFETSTLLVLAQQNVINAPYVFAAAANFGLQTNQGGAAFTPDGSALFAAYNLVPFPSLALRTTASQLTVNSPDGMLIQLGLQIQENLGGKLSITSDGATIYAISQSGFMVLPVGTLPNAAIAVPDSKVALLATDQCGVTAALNSAIIPVRNVATGAGGGGQVTVTASILTSAATSATVRTTSRPYGGDVTLQYSSTAAARGLGTVAPDQLLIQSNQAINIIPNVRVFQNDRNAESSGTVIPVDIGATTTGLTDMLADAARQRLYIANPALNRLEVFDMQKRQFLAPITVGQLPKTLAFGADGNTLYVAGSGGENIGIVDLTLGKLTGRVRFPAIPFNASFALITPASIASTVRGPQVLMSDGTLWSIVGNTVIPRVLNPNIFGTVRIVPAPQFIAATPEGNFMILLAGNGTAYLFDASLDDFVASQVVSATPIQGYYGAVAAGPNGQYYVVNDQLLNQALTPVGGGGTGPVTGGGGLPTPGGPTSRPVSAVAAVGGQTFARFSTAVLAGATAVATDAGLIELVDVASQRTTATANALEGPPTLVRTGQRVNLTAARSMAVDAAGTTVFVLTASGLSVVPIGTAAASATASVTPSVAAGGVVSTANFLPAVAPGGLISIFGKNLASGATAPGTPLPAVLGGTCVTFNNTPLPLMASSTGQINAQLPPTLAAGRYSLVVRSIANQAASSGATVTVAKYAPAIFFDGQGAAIFHQDGTRLDQDHPGHRDEPLTILATGLGTTIGGKVTAGSPAPQSPLAVTGPVNLYFGNPLIKQAGVIVDGSGLKPGYIGVYEIHARIPGSHINGNALPVTVKIGGVSSSTTGPTTPKVWVE